MVSFLLPAVAATSSYAAYLSYTSIQNVRLYEKTTKRAAKISNTAAEQLHSTRTTEASGALATALSLTSALTFTLYPTQPNTHGIHLALAVFNTAAMWFAADHVGRFWAGKTQVPVKPAKEYNDAVQKMESLRRMLLLMTLGWAGDAVLVAGAWIMA